MSDFAKLKRIDAELQEVINPVTFFEVNPMNAESEKMLVLDNPDYNPYFLYPELPFDFDDVKNALFSIDDHDSEFGRILSKKRDLYIAKCEMLLRRGSNEFNNISKRIYGLPTKDTLSFAAGIVGMTAEPEDKTISSSAAVGILQAEINHYGFGYNVSTKDLSSSAMVLVAKKKIYIRNNHSFSERFVRRLAIHEIGTHVLRAENGRKQPFNIFFHGFPGYLSTEEGLAVANEERFGLLSNENLKEYGARALAVEMGQTKSFSEVYKFLLNYFPEQTAFRLAVRVKRGLSDTSRPGGCTKDHVYVDGYMKIKRYVAEGGKLEDLYVGKIGVEHVKTLSGLKGLNKPAFLPKNQSFKNLLAF